MKNTLISTDLLIISNKKQFKNYKTGLTSKIPDFFFDVFIEIYNIKELGYLYKFIIYSNEKFFEVPRTYEEVATILGIIYTGEKNNRFKIRKILNKFHYIFTYDIDLFDKFKFKVNEKFLLNNYNPYFDEVIIPVKQFYQIPYLFKFINDNDLIVVFMALNYFDIKGYKCPSIASICQLCNTTDRNKINSTLKLGEKIGLWKIDHNKSIRKPNNYYLKNSKGRYYYLIVFENIVENTYNLSETI